MAQPTRAECLTLARSHLNDVAVEIFTDTVIGPFFDTAYRRMFDEMLARGISAPERTGYFALPAYTTVLYPASAGILDFGELCSDGLDEAPTATTLTVSGATSASPIEVTTSGAHGLSSNTEVALYGVVGQTGANGRFFQTVTAATKFTLNGSVTQGTYSSGGTVIPLSGLDFKPVAEVQTLPNVSALRQELNVYQWAGDRLNFVGATSARILRLKYTVSGSPLEASNSGMVYIDNSKDFLGTYTAALACGPYDRANEGQRLMTLAMIYLDGLLTPMDRAEQRIVHRRRRFRQTRFNQDYFLPV